MYASVFKNVMHVFDIWYSNLMDSCFVLSLFKNFIKSLLLPVYIKNMSSINLRQINENHLINRYISF